MDWEWRKTDGSFEAVIVTWSKGDVDDNMPEELLLETFEKVQQHPWWRARAKLALTLLRQEGLEPPARILDAGCGWGTNLTALIRAGFRVDGLDVSRRALQLIDRPDRHLIEADLTQDFPRVETLYDGVMALDVIEHLDDDRIVVERLGKLVSRGGIVILSVPALPELYSEFDRIQGHRRRYIPDTLRAAFDRTELVVTRVLWWGAWMVPVLRRTRRKDEGPAAKTYSDYLQVPNWPLKIIMNLLYKWEQPRATKGCLRRGTSLFAIARRR